MSEHRVDSADSPAPLTTASEVVAEVPWRLSPMAGGDLSELDTALSRARRSQDNGDSDLAGRMAEGILVRARTLAADSTDDPGHAHLRHIRAGALAVLAQALKSGPSQGDAAARFRQAVEGLLSSPGTDATEADGRPPLGIKALEGRQGGVVERALSLGSRTAGQHRRRKASAMAAVDAASLLEDALEHSPGDTIILRALVELLELQGSTDQAADRTRELARSLAEEGLYQEALHALDRALTLDPGDDETTLGLADVLRLSGRPADARTALRDVLAAAPNDPRALTIEGLAQLQLGDGAAACDALAHVVEIVDDQGWAHGNLALALQAVGRRDEALREIDRANQLEGVRPTRLLQKALLFLDEDRADDALALLDEALEQDPHLAAAFLARAQILQLQGRLDEARGSIDAALRIRPHSANALGAKAQILREERDLADAEQTLVQAAASDAPPLWVLLELAEVRTELDDVDGAMAAYARAAQLYPSSARALAGKADLQRRTGDVAGARSTVERALELDPDSAEALVAKARILYEQDHYTDAATALGRALELKPELPSAHAWLGEVRRMETRYEDAIEALDRALELDPTNVFAQGTRGQSLMALGRYDEALDDLAATLKAAPDLSWARESLADTLRMLGRRDEAIAVYERVALEDADDSGGVRVKIAEALEAGGRYEEAEERIDGLLAARPQYVPAMVMKGHLENELARFSDAIDVLTAAIELDHDHHWAIYLRGWAHRNLGADHAKAAVADYQRAVELAGELPEYRQKLGEVLTVFEGPEAGRPHFEWVLANLDMPPNGTDPFSILVLGWAQAGLGRHDAAARSFARALEVDEDDVPTRFDLALALLASGRPQLAEREYDGAIARCAGRHPGRMRCLLGVAERELRETIEAPERQNHGLDAELSDDVSAAAGRARKALIKALRSLDAPV